MFEIAAIYYQPLYLAIVATMTLLYVSLGNTHEKSLGGNNVVTPFLAIFMVLFIGLRPASGVFVDMVNYIATYNALLGGVPFQFQWDTDNIIFDNLFAWIGSQRLGYTLFFFLIAFAYFGLAYAAISRLFSVHRLPAYLVFLAAFSTFSYATNGVKAGVAASLFLFAISFGENRKVCIPLVLATIGFHHSMVVPVAAYFLTFFFQNAKLYFYGWVFCLVVALLQITWFQTLFASLTDEQGADYLNAVGTEWGGKPGFRYDFVLYSFVPVAIGYYAIFKKGIESKLYQTLLYTYMASNGVWMLCMYASFTNRIAYLSWFLYPVVLIYPFFLEEWGSDRYKSFAKLMLGHLGFTLFMAFIYY